MSPALSSGWTLGVHATILPFAMVALYRYSDRTQLFSKTVGDMDGALTRMRRRVASALQDSLRPVMEDTEDPTLLLDSSGNDVSYRSRATDAVDSERFREALLSFMDSHCESLAHFQELLRARNNWCYCARRLSWCVLALTVWQILAIAVVGLVDKLFQVTLPFCFLLLSFFPTAFLVGALFLFLALCMWHQDRIHDHKSRYYDL